MTDSISKIVGEMVASDLFIAHQWAARIAVIQAQAEPAAWMTWESKATLERGGNCRGAVPVHKARSHMATIPLFSSSLDQSWDVEALERIAKAAKVYFDGYVQDEASDVDDCVCGREQHEAACELRAALLARREAPTP